MRKCSGLLVCCFALALAGCSGSDGGNEQTSSEEAVPAVAGEQQTTSSETTSGAAVVAVASAERTVACGCSIESVGSCGNYIEIEGEFVYVSNWKELGLGSMEWCGKEGVHATSEGELRDGEFYATTLVAHVH